MKRGPKGLSKADQNRIWAAREGALTTVRSRKLGLEPRRVARFLAGCGGIKPPPRTRSAQCLTRVGHEEISRGIAHGAAR